MSNRDFVMKYLSDEYCHGQPWSATLKHIGHGVFVTRSPDGQIIRLSVHNGLIKKRLELEAAAYYDSRL